MTTCWVREADVARLLACRALHNADVKHTTLHDFRVTIDAKDGMRH